MTISLQELFEELNRRIDKPIEYNHLLTGVIQQIAAGSFFWVDGVPYVYDPLRNKELTVGRPVVTSSYYGQNQSSRYLRMDGVTCSGNGFLAPRKGTLTALWAKSRNTSTWAIEIKRNDNPIVLATAAIISGFGKVDQLDVDFDEGDYLQLYLNGSAVDHPIACFELAWRK